MKAAEEKHQKNLQTKMQQLIHIEDIRKLELVPFDSDSDEEDSAVQLQLLTAAVKCFLKNPEDTQEMVQRALDMATEESDNPDLRDRGFIYWRLLSTDPEAAKLVVLGEKVSYSGSCKSLLCSD